MGRHSAPSNSNARRFAIAGLLAGGAAVGGAGTAVAEPVEFTLNNPIQGIPNSVTVDVPADFQIPAGLDTFVTANTNNEEAPAEQYAAPSSRGQQILDAAATRIGSPYVWGATGPNAFDCSGLTSWAHRQVGIEIPRTSGAQIAGGTKVAKADLQPGDIVAFYSGASHVGIYAGNGQVLHAPTSGSTVSYAPLDSMPFYGATRYY